MSSVSSSCSCGEPEDKSNAIPYIPPLKNNETVSQFTQRLINSNILTKSDENAKNYNQIKNELVRIINHNGSQTTQRRSLYCWVAPHNNGIKNELTFEFEYKLIILHRKDLYYSTFAITFHQMQELYQIARKSKYFPSHGYPTVHSEVTTYNDQFRNTGLVQDLAQEQKHMILPTELKCKGPGKTLFKQREAQDCHTTHFAAILITLFNCPIFAMHDDLYSILNKKDNKNIGADIELLIKHKADQKLNEWRHNLKFVLRKYVNSKDVLHMKPKRCGNPYKLRRQKLQNIDFLSNITFYSVMVASFKNNTIGEHWAVIFEGRYHLLVLEYFLDNDSEDENGFVSFKLIPNTITGQRACFYSFCARYSKKAINSELFAERWSTLRKTFLPKTSFKHTTFNFIHELVKKWMSKPAYYMTSNNCQHFARNIYAFFDKKEAKFLNIQFDHQKMTLFTPSGPIADGLKEGVSMEMFVKQCKTEIKYDTEETLDNFGIIENKLHNTDIYRDEVKYENDEKTKRYKEIAVKLLKTWDIPRDYIDGIIPRMIAEGVIQTKYWIDLEESFLMNRLGFSDPLSKRFKREYEKWNKNKNV